MSRLAATAAPLAGWRVLITRATGQAAALAEPLRQRGAQVLEIPTIEIHPPANYSALDDALRRMGSYNILILTSVNGVAAFFERYRRLGLSIDDLRHPRAVAIGPATARAMEAEGLKVAVIPKRYIAESIVESLRGQVDASSRVLLVRAKVARDVLPTELRKMGAEVDVIEAYETRVPGHSARKLKEIFQDAAARPDVVTFTSSSTVRNFLHLLDDETRKSITRTCLASIGPVTSATLREAGLEPAVEAKEYTMAGLVRAIVDYAGKNLARNL